MVGVDGEVGNEVEVDADTVALREPVAAIGVGLDGEADGVVLEGAFGVVTGKTGLTPVRREPRRGAAGSVPRCPAPKPWGPALRSGDHRSRAEM